MREINLMKSVVLGVLQLSPPLVPVELRQLLPLLQRGGGDQLGPVLKTDSLGSHARHVRVLYVGYK